MDIHVRARTGAVGGGGIALAGQSCVRMCVHTHDTHIAVFRRSTIDPSRIIRTDSVSMHPRFGLRLSVSRRSPLLPSISLLAPPFPPFWFIDVRNILVPKVVCTRSRFAFHDAANNVYVYRVRSTNVPFVTWYQQRNVISLFNTRLLF